MGLDYATNNKGFVVICSSVIGLNQNITGKWDRKPDDCDASHKDVSPATPDFDEPKLICCGLAWTLHVSRLLFVKGLRQVSKKESRSCCGQFW